MKILKKILVIIIIITLVNIFPIIANISTVGAAETVSLSLVPQPYIDVVLSKAKTNSELTNFKKDLLLELEKQKVDIDKVNISSIDSVYNSLSSQDINVDKIINSWETIGAPTWSAIDGKIYSNSPGGGSDWSDNPGVKWNPSKTKSWWGTGLIDPNGYETEQITMDFTMVTGGSLNEGVCFNVTKNDDNSLNGYFVTICNHSNTECRLWRFDHYTLDQSFASGINRNIWCHPSSHGNKRDNNSWNIGHTSTYLSDSFTCLAGWSTGSSNVRYNISYENCNIIVKVNGSVVANVTDNVYKNGTYGFWGNNCEASGLMYINNIKISTVSKNIKKLEEVLREPEWREDSIKVLVNVNDVINEQLNQPTSLGELLTRMINDEIHYAAWGKNINEEQSRNFIAANNNNGIYINNTDYSNSITKTAEYIKSLIESKKSSEYVILNENTILSTADPDIMTNTAGGDFPYGRWKIIHDCEYYENNIGQFAKTGKYISDMITSFNKTGKYDIYYEDREVLPSTIYVHRKPVAEIDIVRNENNVELISLGYDLDCYSNNRGIKEEEWKWRHVGETTWNDGKLTDITEGTDFLVQLRVKDFQDTWSMPVSKYITKNDVLPIASFKIKNQNTSIYEQVEVVDGSYDPYGGTITSRRWTVYKGEDVIYQGDTPLADYMSYGIGNYKMALEVTNDRDMTSETFTRIFHIIPDDEAPEVTILPISCEWQEPITVNLKFIDRLGSGFKEYKYAITDNQEEPTNWEETRTNIEDSITIDQDGIHYLHIVATDNAGNVSEDRVVGPYKIDKTPPVARVSHEPTEGVIDYVTIKWRFTDAQSGMDYIILPDETKTTTIGGEYVVSQNGDYTFKAYDKAGNEKIYTETITNIDQIAPEGIFSLEKGELTDEPTKILWEAYDNESGFDRIVLPDSTISTQATGEFQISKMGIYTFIIYDKAGNDKKIDVQATNVDMEKPSLKVTQEEYKWTNEDISLYWEAHDGQSGIQEVVLPDSTRTKEETGEHIVTENGIYAFIAYDKVGNGILVKHEVKNIDKKAPFLKLKTQYDENDNVEILWEMSDDQSGIRNIALPTGEMVSKKTGKFKAKYNGTYTFIAYDNVGNDTIMQIKVNNLDKEGIRFNLEQEKISETKYVIKWEVEGNQEDYKHILLPNNVYSTEYQGEFIIEEPGDYTFLAYDEAGNETKQTITIKEKTN